jgi:hypothetical protein
MPETYGRIISVASFGNVHFISPLRHTVELYTDINAEAWWHIHRPGLTGRCEL